MKSIYRAIGLLAIMSSVLSMNAQPVRLRILGAPSSATGTVVAFHSFIGTVYTLEASSNLVHWTPLHILRATNIETRLLELPAESNFMRFYRIGNHANELVVEGYVRTPDGRGLPVDCPFCDVRVSSSLGAAETYTDTQGHYLLRLRRPPGPNDVPFTLSFGKVGYRNSTVLVTNLNVTRMDLVTLAGPPNNDFTNAFRITLENPAGQSDNSTADLESGEPGSGGNSVWYHFEAPTNGVFQFVADTFDFEPVIEVYKGSSVGDLQRLGVPLEQAGPDLHRVTSAQLPLRTGDAFHVRLASLPHVLRPLEFGGFSWQARFTTNFPLTMQSNLPVQGRVEVSPAPGADGNYLLGQTVEVRAIPTGNYRFAVWRGSVVDTNAAIQFTVTNAMHLEALFLLRNDSPANADPLPQGIGEVQAAASGGSTSWWKWTAPETRQVGILFNRNGLLHAQVHARPPGTTNLILQAGTLSDALIFSAVAGTEHLLSTTLFSEGSQTFSFRWARPLVFEGTVLGEADLPVRGVAVNFTTPTFQSKYTVLSSTNTDGAGHFTLDTRLIDHPANHNRVLRFFAPAYRELLVPAHASTTGQVYRMSFLGPSNNRFESAHQLDSTGLGRSDAFSYANVEPGESPGTATVWYQFVPPADGTLFWNGRSDFPLPHVKAFLGPSVSNLTELTRLVVVAPQFYLGRNLMQVDLTVKGGMTNYLRMDITSSGKLDWSALYEQGYPIYNQAWDWTRVTPAPVSSNRFSAGVTVELSPVPPPYMSFTYWTTQMGTSSPPILRLLMDSAHQATPHFRVNNDSVTNAFVLGDLPATGAGYGDGWWSWTPQSNVAVVVKFPNTFSGYIEAVLGPNLTRVATGLDTGNSRRLRFTASAYRTYYIHAQGTNSGAVPLSFTIEETLEPLYELNIDPSQGGYVLRDPLPTGGGEYLGGTRVLLTPRPVNGYVFSGWTFTGPLPFTSQPGPGDSLIVTVNGDRSLKANFAGVARFNDNFADRLILESAPYPESIFEHRLAGSGSNSNATLEAAEPAHDGGAPVSRSVWWSFTPRITGELTATTQGSDFDTVLAVYTGFDPDNLRLVGRNNDRSASDKSSLVRFLASAGETYHLAVAGAGTNRGNYKLFVMASEAPTIRQISPITNSWLFGTPIPFEWEITDPDGFPASLQLFTNGVFMAQIDPVAPYRFLWTNAPQGKYEIRLVVTDTLGTRASLTNNLMVRPRGDDFADALALSGERVVGRGSFAGSTREPEEPRHGDSNWNTYQPAGGTLWWTWTAPHDGAAVLQVTSSGPVAVSVYRQDARAKVATLVYYTSSLQFRAERGVTYAIAVESSSTAPTHNLFTLTLTTPPEITKMEPANGARLTNSLVTILAEVADADGIKSVTLSIDGAPYLYNSPPYRFGVYLSPGFHTLIVTAIDNIGATTRQTNQFEVSQIFGTVYRPSTAPGPVTIYTDVLDPQAESVDIRLNNVTVTTVYGAGRYTNVINFVNPGQYEVSYYVRTFVYTTYTYQGPSFTVKNYPPNNDRISDALFLPTFIQRISGSTVSATTDPGERSFYDHTVWFGWTPDQDTLVAIKVTPTTPGPAALHVWTDGSEGLQLVDEHQSATPPLVRLQAQRGQTYFISVDMPEGPYALEFYRYLGVSSGPTGEPHIGRQ